MNEPTPTIVRPETTSPMEEAAAFLLEREPWLREAHGNLLGYLGWYWRDGRVGIVRDGPRILALALGRCLDEPQQARQDYFHREDGRLVWLDHIANTHPLGIPLLLQQAMQRFGPREAFAGNVFKRDGELRMLPWKLVERLTTGVHSHGLTLNSRTTGGA